MVNASDVRISADVNSLRSAADRLKNDDGERQKLQQDPVAYMASMGIHIGTDSARALKSAGMRVAAAPRQAGIIHIDT